MFRFSRPVAALLFVGLFCPAAEAEESKLTTFQITHDQLIAESRQKARAGREIIVHEVPEPSGKFDKDEYRSRHGNRTVSVDRAWSGPKGRKAMGVSPFSLDLAVESIDLNTVSGITGFLSTPPDTMGVVGPTQFFTAQNGAYRLHDKISGAAQVGLDVDAGTFWIVAVDPNDDGGGDPRVRYDRINDRWVVIAFTVNGQSNNRIMIAFSNGPTISGSTVWTQFYFTPKDTENGASESGCFADYPMLGIDRNAIYIGANMFNSCGGSGSTSTAVFVTPIAQMPGGGGDVSSITTAFTGLLQSTPIWSPMPADNIDPASTTGYIIGHDATSDTTLKLGKISNPGGVAGTGTEPTIAWSDVTVSNKNDGYGTGVPYTGVTSPTGSGSSWGLDPLGFRPLGGAEVRGGRLWTAMTSSVNGPAGALRLFPSTGDRHSVVFFEINVTTNALIQDGNVFDAVTAQGNSPMHVWMGSVNVNGQGHAVVGASGANTGAMAPSAVWAARLATDPLGQFSQPQVYLSGTNTGNLRQSFESSARPTRWGDYSQVSIDPCDDMTFYTIQEYQDSPAVATGGNWATGIARILAPAPTFTLASPSMISGGMTSVTVTVTGSGFYSPPTVGMPACRTDIAASSTLGLVVNSVTWVDEGEILIDFNSASAVGGTATVTVTNPDGQTVELSLEVDSGMIFINGFETGNTSLWSATVP